MPRDMTACGRYPPQPWYKPIAFYSAVRLGDPEELAKVMARDPYYLTQDNGAGAPVHFATTYRQLDMARSLSLPLRIAAHRGAPRVPSA
jgi:[acyl-carrier-protein] S-malonyltransferase